MTDLRVYIVSYEHVANYRYSVTVNEETHPELKGMTQDEMKKYILNNAKNMAPVNSIYGNLHEELSNSDIETDKWSNYNEEIKFK
jgi:hypothetical protein